MPANVGRSGKGHILFAMPLDLTAAETATLAERAAQRPGPLPKVGDRSVVAARHRSPAMSADRRARRSRLARCYARKIFLINQPAHLIFEG